MIKANMRIALVGPLPPPSGGMANQTEQLSRLLAGEGCEVRLVRTNADYSPAWIARLPGVRAVARAIPYLFALWSAIGKSDIAHVMANSGWAWHLVAAPAIWISKLRRVPVIVNYRGGGADAFFRRSIRLVRPTLRGVVTVVVPSGFLQQTFARLGISSEIVPNVVDLSRFSPCERDSAAPLLIVTRNLEDIYDVPTAVRAFAIVRKNIPRAELVIAGDGPARAEIERLVIDLELSQCVRLVGNLEPEQMAGLYQGADLMLNASTVDNMPNALLEAMASGVPIVSTDAGGIPFIVENEVTALLVGVRDSRAMASAAIRILSDCDLADRLRSSGFQAVTEYDWQRVRVRLLGAYGRAMGRTAVNRCAAPL